jgi:HTH-type transcriptional regulator, global nitrogen regulator NrpRI
MLEVDKKINTILKIIEEAKEPVGSREIAARLAELGIKLSERTVRYHLKLLDRQGLTRGQWKEGRMITGKGKEELDEALVFEKVGFMSSRIETMAYRMDFDLEKKEGQVILNISFFHEEDFRRALGIMAPVFARQYATSDLVAVAGAGEKLAGIVVPAGRVAFGTLCTINLNGILLKHSIPVESKFGGLLKIEKDRPVRFTDIIEYRGSTLDPHEIFLKSRMTGVNRACSGVGRILAGLREIPAACGNEAEAILRRIDSAKMGRIIILGRPGQSVLGWPIGEERVGLIVPGGLNPVAACEEAGIETESRALSVLADYQLLKSFDSIEGKG